MPGMNESLPFTGRVALPKGVWKTPVLQTGYGRVGWGQARHYYGGANPTRRSRSQVYAGCVNLPATADLPVKGYGMHESDLEFG